MTTDKITFWQFLQNNRVEIPIIQRDYAQGRAGKENLRKHFLISIKEALDDEKELKLDFVYGTVENSTLQPLDGQQRLTTLWLLHWYIALYADRYEEAFPVLSKFSYETRISSREFIQHLCNPAHFRKFDKTDVVHYIQDSTWYYSAWDQDPTISAMLRMIQGTQTKDQRENPIVDGLDELFANTGIETFQAYWQRLTETDAIAFYQQPLKDFGLSDDLYVKMNARGKQLTSFENLKADLIGYLRDQVKDTEENTDRYKRWKQLLDECQGIPIRIDTKWTELFWKNRSKDHKIDEIFFAFLNRFFWNELFTAKKPDGKFLLSLSDESKNPSYVYLNTNDSETFEKYTGLEPYRYAQGVIPIESFEKLLTLLNNFAKFEGEIPSPRWMKGFDFIPTYKEKQVSGINQLQRIIFFALCKYFHEGTGEQTSLERWMRVVYNLISGEDRTGNPEIRDVSNLRKAITYLSVLDSHAVLTSLASQTKEEAETDESPTSVLALRWNEEIAKAIQITHHPEWESRIIKAEQYAFFHGAIRFLFQDENGQIDWNQFDAKWENVQRYFTQEEKQNSVMNKGYHNAELLKTLFSHFTTNQFWKCLWWHYRTFNNKPHTWMYFLLSPSLSAPVHHLLLREPRSDQWAIRSTEDFAKNTLYLLTKTGLLDYVRERMPDSWIRKGRNHRAIYPSSTGIYLDAFKRDDFLLHTDEIEVDKDAQINDTPLLYGWNINFQYQQMPFQWYHTDYIYLMDPNNHNNYTVISPDGDTEEKRFYCFKVDNHSSNDDIITQLESLIERYQTNLPNNTQP